VGDIAAVSLEGNEIPGGDAYFPVESGGAEVEEVAAEGGGGVGEAEAGAGRVGGEGGEG